MLIWPAPKLESGERMRLRLPEPSWTVVVSLLVVGSVLLVSIGLFFLGPEGQHGFDKGFLHYLIKGAGLLFLFPMHSLIYGWRVMVTDRRLFHKASASSSSPDEIRLEDIEEVTQDVPGVRLIVRGVDREIVIPLDGMDACEIVAALGR